MQRLNLVTRGENETGTSGRNQHRGAGDSGGTDKGNTWNGNNYW